MKLSKPVLAVTIPGVLQCSRFGGWDTLWPFSNRCFKYLKITISLPSGNQPRFTREKSSKVGDLRILAQKAFGLADFLRLVTAEGHVLNDPEKSLEAARLSEGAGNISWRCTPAQIAAIRCSYLRRRTPWRYIAATKEASAFWSPGSDRILTWGHPKVTGRCAVQDKLGPVRMVWGTGPWRICCHRLWHGAIQVGAGTTCKSKIGSEMSGKLRPLILHLPRSWRICRKKGANQTFLWATALSKVSEGAAPWFAEFFFFPQWEIHQTWGISRDFRREFYLGFRRSLLVNMEPALSLNLG